MLYTLMRLAPYIFSKPYLRVHRGEAQKLSLVTRDLITTTDGQNALCFDKMDKIVLFLRPWGDLLREVRITTKSAALITGAKVGDKIVPAEVLANMGLGLSLKKWLREEDGDGSYTVRNPKDSIEYFSIVVDEHGDIAFITDGVAGSINRLILILQTLNFPVGFSPKEYKIRK